MRPIGDKSATVHTRVARECRALWRGQIRACDWVLNPPTGSACFRRVRATVARCARSRVVLSDRSILLEVAHPDFEAASRALAAFAELKKGPEHIHTYRITAVSRWNAAAAGIGADEIASTVVRLSRHEVPQAVLADVRDLCAPTGDCA
jgi:hypothetical protein